MKARRPARILKGMRTERPRAPCAIVTLPAAHAGCYRPAAMHATTQPVDGATYVYIDEAGNFDFGPGGTRHFLLVGVVMRRPFSHLGRLLEVEYDLLEDGLDLEHFHASEDRQVVRDRVFESIATDGRDMRLVIVVAEKARLGRALQTPGSCTSSRSTGSFGRPSVRPTGLPGAS